MLVPACDELAGGDLVGTPLNSVHLAVGHQLHGDVSVRRLLLKKFQQQVEGQLRCVSSMVQAVVPSLQVVVGADVLRKTLQVSGGNSGSGATAS